MLIAASPKKRNLPGKGKVILRVNNNLSKSKFVVVHKYNKKVLAIS
jgi:hypothetical protein